MWFRHLSSSFDGAFGLPRYVGADGDADPAIRQSRNNRTPAGP
jgi:hypothetical protein